MLNPIAFHLGPIAVHWYGILIAIAFVIGIWGSDRMVKSQGINEDAYLSIVIFMIIFAVIGARAYYVLFEWQDYVQHPFEIIAVWHGGLAVHGGILAGILTLFIGCRYYKLRFWQIADILAPFLILGQAIGRWGNFFNQEAYGYAVSKVDVPWAMYIDGAYRHPTFLYESIWDFVGFLLLMFLSKKAKIKEGDLSVFYLVYYSIGRFFVEGFRTDSLMLGPLRVAQVISLCLIVVAIAVLVLRRKNAPYRKRFLGTVHEEDQRYGK